VDEASTGKPAAALGGPRGVPATLRWDGDEQGALLLLDQTHLPHEVVYRRCSTAEDVSRAIRELCVRGAPAIGVAGAYGLCLGTRDAQALPLEAFLQQVAVVANAMASVRPTAVNLQWAVRRVQRVAREHPANDPSQRWAAMLAEAHAIAREDVEVCRRIGEHGAGLIRDGATILTHCNAGALATVGWGTALAALYVAHEQGKRFRVYADESRPLLQGARITAFELAAAGIDVTVICDAAAASLMERLGVDLVLVGADRIAANGDTANKIGTYGLALAAHHHNIPFYVAAPSSTFDLSLPSGREIPIEERDAQEVRRVGGQEVVPPGVGCWNPAFDVTPAGLIRGIVTERGVLEPVSEQNIRKIFGSGT